MENLIIDTDFGFDCDDAGALAAANILINEGKINILAVTHSVNKKIGCDAIKLINDYYGNPDISVGVAGRYALNVDEFYEEFYAKLNNRNSFDVEVAKNAFKEMLATEKNIKVMYNVDSYTVGSNGTEIEYAIIDDEKYIAKTYIDCTQDADITVAAGAEYVIGWEDINEKNRSMSATLVIHMDNVDWDKACETIKKENRITRKEK